MKQAFGLLAVVLFLFGCGHEVASPGAVVSAPGDSSITYLPPGGGSDMTASPLEFQVFQVTGSETDPMPGVTIRFFAGDQVIALTDKSGLVALNPNDPTFFETKTDERGLSPTDVYAVWAVPLCRHDPTDATKKGDDVNVTGTVTATVGVDSAIWTVKITVKGGVGTQGCV